MPIENKDTLYAKWLSGDITEKEIKILKESGELEALEAVVEAANDSTMPDYDTELEYEKLMSNQKIKTEPNSKNHQLNTRLYLSVAATLILFLTLYFTLFNTKTIEVVAANTKNIQHTFEGMKVILNDGSSISYIEKNWEKERIVQLTGEAFFDVENGKPFFVKTKNGIIKVLGTSFNVRAWDNQLYVECYEGKVQIESKRQTEQITTLQSVILENDELKMQSFKHKKPLWQSGYSRFYNENVKEVFNELERQYDIKITKNNIAKSFSGSFPHNDLNGALNNICKPLNLKFSISNDRKIVDIEP